MASLAFINLCLLLSSCGLTKQPETFTVKIFPLDVQGCWIGKINGSQRDACGAFSEEIVVYPDDSLVVQATKNPFGDADWRLVLQIYGRDGNLCSSDYTDEVGGTITARCSNN